MRGVGIGHAPVGRHTSGRRCEARPIRIKPQFESADVEADIKRLIEIRFETKDRRVPRLGLSDVVDMVDDGARPLEHDRPRFPWRMGKQRRRRYSVYMNISSEASAIC